MLALNRRVVRTLDLDQILAWQSELEVLHHTRRKVSFRPEAEDETESKLERPSQYLQQIGSLRTPFSPQRECGIWL